MKTNNILISLFFLVYTAIIFLLFPININLGLLYAFSVLNFIIALVWNNNYLSKGKSFNTYPSRIVLYTYLLVQFIVSIILLSTKFVLNLSLVIEIIVLFIFLVLLVLLLRSKEYIEDIENSE
ncbi:hypothetical protein BGI41_01590 [Methanobrevibacter sp. 87.7]|uniref:hypothetical protein n=1 Tax=Methanobrevibacter sp. 87.7 TaxID=387957 RepID=UPI000B506906|nr:hypothetical protein [Methanobrevibacter sp. 87.7]OWT33604.1 hypothetical protein BGI41_01590 [Methanobrevibacter sp. 87.7]